MSVNFCGVFFVNLKQIFRADLVPVLLTFNMFLCKNQAPVYVNVPEKTFWKIWKIT